MIKFLFLVKCCSKFYNNLLRLFPDVNYYYSSLTNDWDRLFQLINLLRKGVQKEFYRFRFYLKNNRSLIGSARVPVLKFSPLFRLVLAVIYRNYLLFWWVFLKLNPCLTLDVSFDQKSLLFFITTQTGQVLVYLIIVTIETGSPRFYSFSRCLNWEIFIRIVLMQMCY